MMNISEYFSNARDAFAKAPTATLAIIVGAFLSGMWFDGKMVGNCNAKIQLSLTRVKVSEEQSAVLKTQLSKNPSQVTIYQPRYQQGDHTPERIEKLFREAGWNVTVNKEDTEFDEIFLEASDVNSVTAMNGAFVLAKIHYEVSARASGGGSTIYTISLK